MRAKYVSRNVQWDSRVSPARQTKFETSIANVNPIKRETLGDALTFYKRNVVAKPDSCAFDRAFNGFNEVLPGQYLTGFRPPRYLGTVVNLAWHLNAFLNARRELEAFRDFPRGVHVEAPWFEERLGRPGPERTAFVAQIFQAIFDESKRQGPKPIWVAEWSKIEPILELPAINWLRFLGCEAEFGYRQIVLALRYGMEDQMPPLFRPTQLDSGNNYLHVPVPGEQDPAIGGFVLNLAELHPDPGTYQCSLEWIHHPFLWKPEFFDRAGAKWGSVQAESEEIDATLLSDRRSRHLSYVRQKMKLEPEWMNDANFS